MPNETSKLSAPVEGAGLPSVASLRGTQAQRRQRIVDEAYRIIVDTGDSNVQIREIAEHAGVALGTAYRYFGSRDRLLAEVYARWSGENRDSIGRRVARGRTNGERLRLLALTLFDSNLERPQMISIARQLRISDDPEVVGIIVDVEERTLQLFRDALVGVDQRDADSIALIVASVVKAMQDSHAVGRVDAREGQRRIAKAVRIALEFRDPTQPPSPRSVDASDPRSSSSPY